MGDRDIPAAHGQKDPRAGDRRDQGPPVCWGVGVTQGWRQGTPRGQGVTSQLGSRRAAVPSLKMAAAPTRRALTQDGRGSPPSPLPFPVPSLKMAAAETASRQGRAGRAGGSAGRNRVAGSACPGPARPRTARHHGLLHGQLEPAGRGGLLPVRGGLARYRYRYRREAAPPRPRPGGPGAGRGAARGGLRAGHGSWGWPGGSRGGHGSWGWLGGGRCP